MQLARREFQQGQRIGVHRMQVFEHQHQWLMRRAGQQQTRHRVHEAKTRLLRLELRAIAMDGGHQLGHQLTDRRCQMRLFLKRRARAIPREQGAQYLNPRPVDRRATRLPGEAPVNRGISGGLLGGELHQQAALADAGLAADEAQRAAPAGGRIERTAERRDLARAPHECTNATACHVCLQD